MATIPIHSKLAEVVSDVSGVTGMAIIRAILRGERDPLELAKLRNDHCKRTQAEIARALCGNWRWSIYLPCSRP